MAARAAALIWKLARMDIFDHMRSRVGGVRDQGRALGSYRPGAAATCAGLIRGVCLRSGFDLEISLDEFFDHTGWVRI